MMHLQDHTLREQLIDTLKSSKEWAQLPEGRSTLTIELHKESGAAGVLVSVLTPLRVLEFPAPNLWN